MKKNIVLILTGLIIFGIYLYSVYPTVPPYRDSGDLTLASWSLGIAHPPGYPSYTLASRIFTFIFNSGNTAYRINLFSCMCSAGTIVLLILILQNLLPAAPITYFAGITAGIILAVSTAFWNLSVVSEMYTLNIFFICLILYLLLLSGSNLKYVYLIFFIFAAGLGNHQSIILAFPGIIYYLYDKNKNNLFSPEFRKLSINSGLFFLLGFTIYLFLPVRASTNPLLNWGNPVTIKQFIDVITRAGYGSLSLYEGGQNTFRTTSIYLSQLWSYFSLFINRISIIGFLLGLAGLSLNFKNNTPFKICTLLIFIIAGPVFFIWANLKLSDYTLAILEPNYIIPDTVFAIWIAEGIWYILNLGYTGQLNNILKYTARTVLIISLSVYTGYTAYSQFALLNKRDNYIARDYSVNTFKSMEPNSVIFAKSDTMFFSMRYIQAAEKIRQDTRVLPYWLPDWYIKQITDKWSDFIVRTDDQRPDATIMRNAIDKLTFYTNYTEGLEEFKNYLYYGILFKYRNTPAAPEMHLYGRRLLPEFYIYRSFINTTGDISVQPDYYNQEIIKAYSVGYYNLAIKLLSLTKTMQGITEMKYSWYYDPKFELSYTSLGLLFYQKQKYEEAEFYYKQLLAINPGSAAAHNALGVIYAQLNNLAESVKHLEKSVSLGPTAETYNNLGGVYYKLGNKQSALDMFRKALELDPNNTTARKNYEIVR